MSASRIRVLKEGFVLVTGAGGFYASRRVGRFWYHAAFWNDGRRWRVLAGRNPDPR